MNIIAFVNQKGGVCKTTSCLNVGAALARAGKSVLLIDADAQGSLTAGAGIELHDGDLTLWEALKGTGDINKAIQQKPGGAYDILPADIALSGADIELSSIPGRDFLLREALAQLVKPYDFILIDCPPSLGVVTLMALTASTGAIIPLIPHYYSLHGMAQLMDTINIVKRRMNPQLDIIGVLLSIYDGRTILHKDVAEAIESSLPGKLFKTKIKKSIKVAEAPGVGKDVFEYNVNSVSTQYIDLSREIMERV